MTLRNVSLHSTCARKFESETLKCRPCRNTLGFHVPGTVYIGSLTLLVRPFLPRTRYLVQYTVLGACMLRLGAIPCLLLRRPLSLAGSAMSGRALREQGEELGAQMKQFEAERNSLISEESSQALKQSKLESEMANRKLKVATENYYGLESAMARKVTDLEATIASQVRVSLVLAPKWHLYSHPNVNFTRTHMALLLAPTCHLYSHPNIGTYSFKRF